MTKGLNKLEIIGNLGSEPELRYTPSSKPVTQFSVACNYVYVTKDGQKREETDWFTVIAWGRLAEITNQFCFKGQLVFVTGRVKLHKWEGLDGKERSRNELTANTILFLSAPNNKSTAESGVEEEFNPEDIPF